MDVILLTTLLEACAFMMVRNFWVYRARKKLIWDDHDTYLRLPSYGAMMWRFWVWDVRRFLP